jgi:chromate transporter
MRGSEKIQRYIYERKVNSCLPSGVIACHSLTLSGTGANIVWVIGALGDVMKELLVLYWTFFKIGGVTFGGGYSMLPMLETELVKKQGWITTEEIMDYYAIGQCTPGIIAVNTATFVGNKLRGVAGAVFATAGIVTPSLIIIMLIASFLRNFSHLAVVGHAFAGIRTAVCALVLNSVVKLWKSGIKDTAGVFLFAAAFIVVAVFSLSPAYVVVASTLTGIFLKRKRRRPEQ